MILNHAVMCTSIVSNLC